MQDVCMYRKNVSELGVPGDTARQHCEYRDRDALECIAPVFWLTLACGIILHPEQRDYPMSYVSVVE